MRAFLIGLALGLTGCHSGPSAGYDHFNGHQSVRVGDRWVQTTHHATEQRVMVSTFITVPSVDEVEQAAAQRLPHDGCRVTERFLVAHGLWEARYVCKG